MHPTAFQRPKSLTDSFSARRPFLVALLLTSFGAAGYPFAPDWPTEETGDALVIGWHSDEGSPRERELLHHARVMRDEGISAFRAGIQSPTGLTPLRQRAVGDLFSQAAANVLATDPGGNWTSFPQREHMLTTLRPYVAYLEQREWTDVRQGEHFSTHTLARLDLRSPVPGLTVGELLKESPASLGRKLLQQGVLLRCSANRLLLGLDVVFQPSQPLRVPPASFAAWGRFGPETTRSDIVAALGLPTSPAPEPDDTPYLGRTPTDAPHALVYDQGGYRVSFEFLSEVSLRLAAISVTPLTPVDYEGGIYSSVSRPNASEIYTWPDWDCLPTE